VNTYEIRVIFNDARTPAIYARSHISDHAAVRRAQTMAGADSVIEVWRGATCVYSGLPKYAIAS